MQPATLKGRRLGGAGSNESTRLHQDLAPHQTVTYECPRGHEFSVDLFADADAPVAWKCRSHGVYGTADGTEIDPPKQGRTHWDMLRERRTIPELEELLAARLAELREYRAANLRSPK